MNRVAVEVANIKSNAGYRAASKPEIVPACRNCKHFRCDHDDRESWKGVSFRRVNVRCAKLDIFVILNAVCDSHEFHHPDRMDR